MPGTPGLPDLPVEIGDRPLRITARSTVGHTWLRRGALVGIFFLRHTHGIARAVALLVYQLHRPIADSAMSPSTLLPSRILQTPGCLGVPQLLRRRLRVER